MMMIMLRLRSLLALKFRCHRPFRPRPPKGVFSGGGISVDSWTLGLKLLCHRHPTGPHPSGLMWTPAKGDSTKSNFALARVAQYGATTISTAWYSCSSGARASCTLKLMSARGKDAFCHGRERG